MLKHQKQLFIANLSNNFIDFTFFLVNSPTCSLPFNQGEPEVFPKVKFGKKILQPMIPHLKRFGESMSLSYIFQMKTVNNKITWK